MTDSQPPRFCADCFKGTLRGDVEPRGAEETIHGLPTYVARPDEGREPAGVVVVLPDAFGWKLRNTRALADSYANRIPAVVLLPELMNGCAMPESVLSIADRLHTETSWLRKLFYLYPVGAATLIRHFIPLLVATRSGVLLPRMKNYLQALRTSPPLKPTPAATAAEGLKIGVAGFCWGGKYTTQLAQGASGPFGAALVDAGYAAHPSMLSVPGDLEKVVLPLSVANGDDDAMLPRAKMALLKEALRPKTDCEVVEYPGAKHGFAVRGDPNDERQADFGMRAEDQAVRWFRRWFGQAPEA